MKTPVFEYQAPQSVDEVTALLGRYRGASRVLAGGQSLVPDLRCRSVRPEVVVDINRVPGLAGLAVSDHRLEIGALVRHAALEALDHTDPLADLLRRTARHIGHPPIRVRGTFVGSLAYAHPAAEWGALAVAMDASIHLASSRGHRSVEARHWFTGRHTTAREPDELIVGATLPLLGQGWTTAFAEHRRTHASFAQVGVVAAVHLEDGKIRRLRLALSGGADRPLRATDAEALLADRPPSEHLFAAAGEVAAAASYPMPEPHCSSEYRRHVIAVLVHRALREATSCK